MIDEKVLIERLENEKLQSIEAKAEAIIGMCGASANVYCGEVDAYEKAIDIVKDLASKHNNDFCEWRKVNSNEYVCDAHAETHDSRVLDWCVCPYCGKEIKVVNSYVGRKTYNRSKIWKIDCR